MTDVKYSYRIGSLELICLNTHWALHLRSVPNGRITQIKPLYVFAGIPFEFWLKCWAFDLLPQTRICSLKSRPLNEVFLAFATEVFYKDDNTFPNYDGMYIVYTILGINFDTRLTVRQLNLKELPFRAPLLTSLSETGAFFYWCDMNCQPFQN